jgi:hypothetical protein
LPFFFWPLYCMYFDLRLLITPIVFSHLSCAYLWIINISQRNYISFRNLIIQSYIKVDNVACTWLCGVNWNSKRHHQRDLEEKSNRTRNETINMHILSNMNIRFLIRLDRHDIAEILLKLTLSTNQSTNKIILYTVNVLLFVGTNCRGFYKMHWSMTYWMCGFKHYTQQSMGGIVFRWIFIFVI